MLTGLRRAAGVHALFVCCTNDVVPDDAYERITDGGGGRDGLVVAGAVLQRRFVGGMLVAGKYGNGSSISMQ